MFPKNYRKLFEYIINRPPANNQLIYATESPYQTIKLYKNLSDYWLELNGIIQFHTKEMDITHYYMVDVPYKLAKKPKSMLIIGGGDGLPAKHALKYPLKITNVELDTKLINLTKNHPVMRRISKDAFNNSKLNLLAGDGISFLNNSKQKYDLIIDDCEIEFTKQPKQFKKRYKEYIKNLYFKLNPGGITCIMHPILFDKDEEDIETAFKILKKKRPTQQETKWLEKTSNEYKEDFYKDFNEEKRTWQKIYPYVAFKLVEAPYLGFELYFYIFKNKPTWRQKLKLRLMGISSG
jgi:spermidine synthase